MESYEEAKAFEANMSNLQKAYCRYRSQGLSMSQAAQRAGSNAKDKGSLARVGYQIENMAGAKDYIEFLKSQRSYSKAMDDQDISGMLLDVYNSCMLNKNYREANKALELLGKAKGLFDKDFIKGKRADGIPQETSSDAFMEDEDDHEELSDKIAKLQEYSKIIEG